MAFIGFIAVFLLGGWMMLVGSSICVGTKMMTGSYRDGSIGLVLVALGLTLIYLACKHGPLTLTLA